MGNKQSSNTQQASSSATSASSSSSTAAVPPHALPRRSTVTPQTQSSAAGGIYPPTTATSSAYSYAEAASHGNLRRINQSAAPTQTVILQPPPQQSQQIQPHLPPPPTAQRQAVVSRTVPQRPQIPSAAHRHGSVHESAEPNPYIMIMQLLQEALGNSSTTATNPNTRVIYRTGHPTATTPLLLRPPQQQQVPRNRAQFDPWMMLLENLVEEADMRQGGGASLQQLMQQMEPVNRGISQEQIEAESMKFTLKDVQKELPKDQQECPICLSEFSTGETLRRLPCLHVYHAECVDKWIQANATCPTCRIDLKELLRQQQEFAFVE